MRMEPEARAGRPVRVIECREARDLAPLYHSSGEGSEEIGVEERRALRYHLQGCDACRSEAWEREPLMVFAPLADHGMDPGVSGAHGIDDARWDGFWEGILTEITAEPRSEHEARDEGSRTARSRRFHRGWMAAAAALMAVLAGATLMAPGPEAPSAGRPVASHDADTGESVPMPQTVEQVRTTDAREVQIYSMTYYQGAEPGETGRPATELVLIVDAGLDL